ncbi:glyoxalase/bleomycin resistance/dioxygenase family protein [Spongiactinospora sp. TRM90649]|uniref:glyoxalase/bleomycin resistance/dioxygenase family protein n=1 Tax=Spongiactinospora sp. TRM90649 TaxID=3031114 RepID=UPI0023FA4226|nr:glyoxalase/bleomycin resistance/dioxygenase family protein [Spongiactinospora sp. TRM90649]MDF5751093.1 glyoxalase/bleomycin resistance/dioxygenase family protein [Spongiactinospora sp. TRM90649]
MRPDDRRAMLIVVYTDRLWECADFYSGIGLPLRPEQHGNGPEHHAAELDGIVFELYPASERRPATGNLRLGFTVPTQTVAHLQPGRHLLTDPDGRTVELRITRPAAP